MLRPVNSSVDALIWKYKSLLSISKNTTCVSNIRILHKSFSFNFSAGIGVGNIRTGGQPGNDHDVPRVVAFTAKGSNGEEEGNNETGYID